MKVFEIIILGIALSMDAFAVAICKGIALKKTTAKDSIAVGGYFGLFQAIMPMLGYLIGKSFQEIIARYDHWIAFALLTIIGINMVREAIGENNEDNDESKLNHKEMIILAIATSIDAFVVGITFAFLNVNVIKASVTIGITTFIMSTIGVKMGKICGKKYGKNAEIIGGIILIALAIKIVLEHLNIL